MSAGALLRACVLLLLALRWCWKVWLCVCVILCLVSVLLTGLLGALYGGWQGALLDVAVWHAAGVDRPADGAA